MSKHITESEFIQYFNIITSKSSSDDDIDFIDEIDAHLSECSECFEKMQTARLLARGLVSDKQTADAFIRAWYPEAQPQPIFDIKKVFMGVKVVLTNKMQALADTLSDRMDARFVPNNRMLAFARSNSELLDFEAINDLLHSSMEFILGNGRKISLCCRKSNNSDDIILFACSNFEVDFVLMSGEEEIPLYRKEHDDLIGEYVYSYKLSGDSFYLTVR